MKILLKKEIRRIIDELRDYYGIKKLELDYLFLQNKDKVYLISKDFKRLNSKNLRINNLGLYFLNIEKGFRLSIEGSQIIGKKATKNIYTLNDQELKDWLRGYDLECKEVHGYQIIKDKNDFYGIGSASNGKMKNFIPKSRRIKNV